MEKKCQLCNNTFDCQEDPIECWCNGPDVKPYIPRIKGIAHLVSDCICKTCMTTKLPAIEENKK